MPRDRLWTDTDREAVTDTELAAGAKAVDDWQVFIASDGYPAIRMGSGEDMSRVVLDAVTPLIAARVREQVAEEIAQAIEVAQGDRCPTCRGKPASVKWRGLRKLGRCGGGHEWEAKRWAAPVDIARAHRTTSEAANG